MDKVSHLLLLSSNGREIHYCLISVGNIGNQGGLGMKMNHRKKILILGGTKHLIEAVKTAKRKGFSPIVVDNIIGSPAKAFADKHYSLNLSDVKGLAKLVKEEGVAGIFAAFENLNTWHAIALCKSADLPFYADDERTAFIINNEKFLEICDSFNVPVIAENWLPYEYEATGTATWGFPVLLKSPVKAGEWSGNQ